MSTAGPWGATLVRFLFGLPFACLFLLIASLFLRVGGIPSSTVFWQSSLIGGGAQVLATAALLSSMKGGFALGSTLQHSSLPLAAAFGAIALGDALRPWAWFGIALATFGLVVLTLPKSLVGSAQKSDVSTEAALDQSLKPILFGIAAAVLFAISANAYRAAGLATELSSPIAAGLVTLVAVQLIQTLGLGAFLLVLDRRALRAIGSDLKVSTAAGMLGSAASALWFISYAMVPAALVRAINALVEAPSAAVVGFFKFGERPSKRTLVGLGLLVAGVALAAIGN
jgi:drug/metabolite transporter (DMT)-like permease